jgi:lantibiotic modifying enzyme
MQKIRKIYRTLCSEYLEYKKMVDAVENIPLRIIERNVQDLISIIKNSENPKK